MYLQDGNGVYKAEGGWQLYMYNIEAKLSAHSGSSVHLKVRLDPRVIGHVIDFGTFARFILEDLKWRVTDFRSSIFMPHDMHTASLPWRQSFEQPD